MTKKVKGILMAIICSIGISSCGTTSIMATEIPIEKIENEAQITTASKITIDGVSKDVYGFNLNGNNYYHLRSLANAMKDTTGRFNLVNWDMNNIYMESGYNYAGDDVIYPEINNNELQIDLRNLYMNEYLLNIKSFNINGNIFVEIRGIADNFGYTLNYVGDIDTIECNTTNSICANIRDKVYHKEFTYDPFTKIDLTIDEVNIIMSHSSISGYGQYFYDMQEEYGVNIIYAIAVAYVESGRGKYPCASYNYFGMIGNSYSTPQAGINGFGALMNKSIYYGKSIEQIAPIYCDSSWAGQIKSMMREIWGYIS